MNTFQQKNLLTEFQNEIFKRLKLDESKQLSEYIIKRWVKKYYKENSIKVFPKSCYPKDKAGNYSHDDIVTGQDNNQYICLKRTVYKAVGGQELPDGKPRTYSYWKRYGFPHDRKLPHVNARDHDEGYSALGNDGETMYTVVLAKNGISKSHYKKWELKFKKLRKNPPNDDPEKLEPGTVRKGSDGFYKVNVNNKWLRMRNQPNNEDGGLLVKETTVKKIKKDKEIKKETKNEKSNNKSIEKTEKKKSKKKSKKLQK